MCREARWWRWSESPLPPPPRGRGHLWAPGLRRSHREQRRAGGFTGGSALAKRVILDALGRAIACLFPRMQPPLASHAAALTIACGRVNRPAQAERIGHAAALAIACGRVDRSAQAERIGHGSATGHAPAWTLASMRAHGTAEGGAPCTQMPRARHPMCHRKA